MEKPLVQVPDVPLEALRPFIILVFGAFVLLLLDAFVPKSKRSLGVFAAVFVAAALLITANFLGSAPPHPFPGMFVSDDFAHVFDLVFYLAALVAVLLSWSWHEAVDRGEYWALLLLTTAGMVALAHASNLVTVFLGIEVLSVGLYVLTGFLSERERSLEAALKYFFLGAFSSSFLLYGIALVYGTTGTFDLERAGAALAARQAAGEGMPLLLLAGAGLLLVGFGFKVSSVPFHMWTPDVYQGAPTPVAAFMSVGTKAAAFAAFLRVFTVALAPAAQTWAPVVAGVAVATMLVGNVIALTQRNLKRLLAFSSIAHAGYALVGLVAWDKGGRAAVLFYLVAYAFMNLGAFGVVAALERRGEGMHLHDLAGLSRKRPLAAAAMALFLLSLAGVPPTAGFMGKFALFLAAVEAGWTKLAVLAVIYSAIAAYFYLRIIVVMYMQAAPEGPDELPRLELPQALTLAAAAAGVVVLGVAPRGVLEFLARAAGGP